MPFTALDAALCLAAAAGLWWMLLRNMAKMTVPGARFRYGRMLAATLTVSIGFLVLFLWSTRGLRGHPDEWLPLPFCLAILLSPLLWGHCLAQAGISMKRLERRGGLFWRRIDAADGPEISTE